MADFVQKSIVKSAVRTLTTPIADAAAFAAIPASVISTNPFGCTSYEVSGVTMDPVTKTRENYGARIVYEDDDAKTVGTLAVRAPSTASFATIKTEILGDAEITAAMGGDPANDAERETYSATLRCHDPAGETYSVTFTRTEVRVTSYSDDSILALVEAWADTVPALA
jgi:hypothetical protein